MKMFNDLAAWWPLISPPSDYEEEAAEFVRILREAKPEVVTCLELGAGGGNNASYMKAALSLTLVDLSDGMLEHSRALNPECEHVVADMRTVRLNRTFDAVFIHDAIDSMATRADLQAVAESAAAHLLPGGVGLFCPDHTAEGYEDSTFHEGHDADDGRAVRLLEWTWDPDPDDEQYVADYTIVMREADGTVQVVHDRHVCGLFSRQAWIDTLQAAGFVEVTPISLGSTVTFPQTYDVFLARK